MNTKPFRLTYAPKADDAAVIGGYAHPIPALLCFFGFFLHIVFSDPLLNTLGYRYSGLEGDFYEKIHPGTYFIYLSFLALLWVRNDPLAQIGNILKRQPASVFLVIVYILAFIYMIVRSGTEGMAFIIDTHITVPICAIVICFAPRSMCRRVMHLFIAIAILNSVIGIIEAIGKFRIFNFYTTWGVLKEDQFRASALRGHPLDNAMFTNIALFLAIALRYPNIMKTIFILIFMTSLVAFGGRAGLAVSSVGLFLYASLTIRKLFSHYKMTLLKALIMASAIILVPVFFIGGLYVMINSSMGERIATHSAWDDSARSREVSLLAFDYMTTEEIIFGVSPERTSEIAHKMTAFTDIIDIENPWLLIIMQFGAIIFPFWLIATFTFAWGLVRKQSLGIQLGILCYYIIASTSNSFGRKDSTYIIIVGAIMCAVRTLFVEKPISKSVYNTPTANTSITRALSPATAAI